MKPSYVRQRSLGVQEAEPVQWPVPSEIFQLLDPPTARVSPDKVCHRDAEIFKVSVTATVAGATETVFQVLVNEHRAGDPVDILAGVGVLPPIDPDPVTNPDVGRYREWWLNPRPTVSRMFTRISVNVTQVGTGVTGIIFEILYI